MSLFGVADAIGAATGAVGAAIERDLQNAATVASMGGSFQVDLEVLYRYYGELTELYEHAGTLLAQYQAEPANSGAATSPITGVTAAEIAEYQAWRGESSLIGSLRAIRGDLSEHLSKLHESYSAYVKADQDGSQRLTAAANPEVAASTQTPATKPTGWGS